MGVAMLARRRLCANDGKVKPHRAKIKRTKLKAEGYLYEARPTFLEQR
jgi:hypothetical protein